jgi:hypothetical protein
MVAKKKAAGRSSAKVEAPGNTQSAAERRTAEAELNSLVEKHAPEHQKLVAAMRKALLKRLPTANELSYEYANQGAVVLSYSPNEHGYDGVLAIRASADGVKLYFNQGKDLPDPEKLLKGSSQTRWIAVEDASTLARPAVKTLIDEALARNSVPFATAGRGSVIIQSTSAKKKRNSG